MNMPSREFIVKLPTGEIWDLEAGIVKRQRTKANNEGKTIIPKF